MRLLLLPPRPEEAVPRRKVSDPPLGVYESVAAVPRKYTVPSASTIGRTREKSEFVTLVPETQVGRTPLAVAAVIVAAGSPGTVDSVLATLRSRRVTTTVA